MPRSHNQSRLPSTHIELTSEDLRILVAVSDLYQRSMGPMRHLVRLTASGEMRGRLRFVAEESAILQRFAAAMLADAEAGGKERARVPFTVPAAIAFWGRLLASLQSSRSRRRLTADEIQRREALAQKLEDVVRRLRAANMRAVDAEIATRRPVEQDWMRSRLEPPGD
jgi:hypothetical protein